MFRPRFFTFRIASVALVVLALVLVRVPQVSAQEHSPLQWSVTPFLWAANTKVDLRLRGQDLGSSELSFDDLLDVTDQSFMVNVEAGRGHWSVLADVSHITMSDTDERVLLTVASRNKQSFIDLAAAFWPKGVGSPLSFIGGIRASLFDDRYQFLLNDQLLGERHSSSDYVDLLVGVRYRFPLNDRWSLQTDGNLSFGDSKGTFVARAYFVYAIGSRDRYQVLFGYQYKEADFADGDLRSDFVYGGPGAGFSFRF